MSHECGRFLEGVELPTLMIGVDGALLFGNAAWREYSPRDTGEPWGWTTVVANDERERVRREVEHSIAEKTGVEIEFHARCPGAPPRVLSMSLGPFTETGEFSGLFGVVRDVSEARRREQRLAFMAGHDPLTGLANRRAFEEALERASSLSGRDVPSVLVMLDMDHLKRYNDARGHLEGDQALVNLAMMLRSHIRASDLAVRIGGDEFALLLSGASIIEANEIVERLLVSASGEFVAGAREVGLGVSGGIAAVERGVEPRVVMDRADAAMYAAKRSGRHSFVTWSQDLGGAGEPERLSDQVRAALADDGIGLVFQPVVRLADGEVAYYESLVRLRDGDGTMMPPGEFLPAVARLGLIPRLALRVLELAITALEANPGAAVSVNLSSTEISDPRLLEQFATTIESAGLDTARLVLEVSEEALLGNLSDGIAWIERLAPLGCRFVFDDFGTGPGVFVLLGIARVEQVKLSRDVIEALTGSVESRQFVRAVRELIESHGKTAVAAFVEADSMLVDAMEAGFEFGQGYSLHEPVEDLGALIAEMSARGC